MTLELKPVRSAEEWAALHRIRREVLFPPGRHPVGYDEDHPHDRAPENTPYLLVADGEPVGAARLDRSGTTGIVRLVAVVAARQGQGLGRALGALLDAEAARAGLETLRVYAHPGAVAFYERLGWRRIGDETVAFCGSTIDLVLMEKHLPGSARA